MHSLQSFEKAWVCHFKKNLKTNSIDMLSFLKNVLIYLVRQYSLNLRLFKWFISDILLIKELYPLLSCYLSVLIFAAVAQLFCIIAARWVLRRQLKRERAKRLSGWRKTFRITVHFSSYNMQLKSALQIALQKMQLWLALKTPF